MADIIQINTIKRKIGQLLITAGIKQLRNSISDFSTQESNYIRFKDAMGFLNVPVSELDSKYYFTSYENWLKVIETLNPITKEFPWLAEVFDCDDRATLITALVNACFEINTCRTVYCKVWRVSDGKFAYAHYANIFVDDSDRVWLWDADEKGQHTRITSLSPVINNKRYELLAVK
jgi:hypothetical protein